MISRQLLCTTVVYQCQSVHPSLAAPSMRGIVTPGGGGLRSGSFQTNNILSCSSVVQACVRASLGVRLLYGTCLHRPSPPQRQSWNGHAISLPLTSPCERSPPMWRQYASSTLMLPSALRKMTSFCPKALTACGLPSPKSLIRPRQCQPRANLVGTARASMSRTSSASGCDIIGTIEPPRPVLWERSVGLLLGPRSIHPEPDDPHSDDNDPRHIQQQSKRRRDFHDAFGLAVVFRNIEVRDHHDDNEQDDRDAEPDKAPVRQGGSGQAGPRQQHRHRGQ